MRPVAVRGVGPGLRWQGAVALVRKRCTGGQCDTGCKSSCHDGRGDAPQGTRNLIDLVRAEDQKFVAQTLSAIEPPPVVGKEGFDEIAVHVQVIGPNRPPGEKVRLGGLDGGRSPPDECPLCGARPRYSVNSTGRRNTSMMRCCDAETETETVRPGGSACDAFAWSAAGRGA